MSDDDNGNMGNGGDEGREELTLEQGVDGADTEGDLVRKALEKIGRPSRIREIRRACLADGVFTDRRIEQILNQGLDAVIRKQIKVENEEGLPFAAFVSDGTVEDEEAEDGAMAGGKRWAQLDLLKSEDFDANHAQKMDLIDGILVKDRRMNRFCWTRTGHLILTPRLTTEGVKGYDED
jgi:hypothetical protein